ncbi:SRPBCC family protein [Nocardia pseudobrasiliensis]|uniref:Polyketide cyclase/dehydrase/lipid transport protein n=1 Tax=Nocardia pseudobrasiliensis TaxID=45979 RepID=A0A370I2V1_9NOCA|nr:SRPBCC family protein [Nocardia pseudobrasiliensis]RDI65053.1 polyketide cyclase/dehydrase/lipid transport protein [Nocardia pseudobrasiliensis]
MATVQLDIEIDADADSVWKVVGGFATAPERMTPGWVSSCVADGGVRVVTLRNGIIVRERLIAVDEHRRRIVYSVVGDTVRPVHDNASMQVFATGPGRSRLVWIHDVLPDELAELLHTNMSEAVDVMRNALADS